MLSGCPCSTNAADYNNFGLWSTLFSVTRYNNGRYVLQCLHKIGCARRVGRLQRDLHPANGFTQLHHFDFFKVIYACPGSDRYLCGRVAFIKLVIEVYSQLLQANLDGNEVVELQAWTCTTLCCTVSIPALCLKVDVPFSGTGCSQDVAATHQTANRCLLAHPATAPRHSQAWRL